MTVSSDHKVFVVHWPEGKSTELYNKIRSEMSPAFVFISVIRVIPDYPSSFPASDKLIRTAH